MRGILISWTSSLTFVERSNHRTSKLPRLAVVYCDTFSSLGLIFIFCKHRVKKMETYLFQFGRTRFKVTILWVILAHTIFTDLCCGIFFFLSTFWLQISKFINIIILFWSLFLAEATFSSFSWSLLWRTHYFYFIWLN